MPQCRLRKLDSLRRLISYTDAWTLMGDWGRHAVPAFNISRPGLRS